MNKPNEAQEVKKINPPYTPLAIVNAFLSKIQNINPPTDPITVQTLRSWAIAQNQEYFLLSALKFLKIIDEKGVPTEKFSKLQTTGEQFKKEMENIVREAYSDFFKLYKDLGTVSREQIIAFFQNSSNVSKERMAKMFGFLCHLGGMENKAYPWSNGDKTPETSVKPIRKSNFHRRARNQKASKSVESEDNEILRLAEIMKDWEAEKVKTFFDGIRESYAKKKNEDE